MRVSSVPKAKWSHVAKLYISGLPMRIVAERMGVSIDAITYILRKSNVPRRSFKEANRIAFETKAPSFTLCKQTSAQEQELNLIGAMLYWAEGYKRDTAPGLDFANSDPAMIALFMRFLHARYILDERRLQCSVYAYADQNLTSLVKFWINVAGVKESCFRNHYIRKDFKIGGRKLPYGVLHIRYNDKKLLRDVLNLIESCKVQYRVGGGAVNRTRL